MRSKGALVVMLAMAVPALGGVFSASAQAAAVQCPPKVAFERPPARSNGVRSFRGTATGTEPVVVRVYRGEHAEGKLEVTLEGAVSEGKWATPNMEVALPEGAHTAIASEACEGGEEGMSVAVIFGLGFGGPWVTMESVALRSTDATPSFRGWTSESEMPVVVHIYKGATVEGAVVGTAEAQPHQGKWEAAPLNPPLEPGTYTAVASQASIYESEEGKSEAVTFIVEASWRSTEAVRALLGGDGSGRVFIGSEGAWSWQACNEEGIDCRPFGTGYGIGTGSAAAGTVFVASEPSMHEMARSPVWHGDAKPGTPPSISGEIRANALVTAISATWSGGWAGDLDIRELAACETAEGVGCTALTAQSYGGRCPAASAVIDPAFTSYYLAVVDELYGPGTSFPAYEASPWPYQPRSLEPGPTTAVAVLGQIAPATGPRESNCGPLPLQPTVTLNPLSTPTEDATPSFSGTAINTTDPAPVTVQVFQGSKAEGLPVATPKALVYEDGHWASAQLSRALSKGTYTAIASEQSSFGKAEGKSSPVTFQVEGEPIQEYLESRGLAQPEASGEGVGPGAIIPPPVNPQAEKEFWERMAREKLEREQAERKAKEGTAAMQVKRLPHFYVLKHPKREHCKASYVKTRKFGIKRKVHGRWVTEHPIVCLRATSKS